MSNDSRILAEIERRKAELRANSAPPAQIDIWPSDRALSEISLGCGCVSLIGVGAPVVTDSKLVMWAFIAAGCVGLAAVIVLRIIRYFRMRQRRPPVSIILRTWRWTLASLIVVALALWIAPHFAAAPSAKDIAEEVSKLITLPKDDSADPPKLLLECQLKALPTVGLPKQTTLVMIVPFRFDKEGTIGFSGMPTEPGQPIKWPEEWKDKMVSSARCHLTNYGKATLFNVVLPFKVRFIRIKRGENPGSTTASETINVDESALPITKIEPGDDGAYIFYIHNQGRDVLQAEFLSAARYLPPGSTAWQPITVIQSASIIHQAGSLWPVRSVEEILGEEEKNQSPK